MKHPSLPLLALMAAIPAPALSQDILLEGIVVSASLEETEASRTGATVEVVTEETMRAAGDQRLVDTLKRLPGVNVTTRGAIGSQSGLTLRGASQNYVAVRVDDIDVTDPTGTQVAYDFGQLGTADISRVEVLKGSQSALYGSGAVGGVISITTRKPVTEGTHHSVEAEYGSFNTRSLSYGVTHLSDTLEGALTLGRVDTDGFSNADEAEGNSEDDGYTSSRLSFRLARTFDNGVKLGINGFAEDSSSDYDPQYYLNPALLGTRLSFDEISANEIVLGDGASSDERLERTSSAVRAFAQFETGQISHAVDASVFITQRTYLESEVAANYADYDPVADTYGTYLQATENTYRGKRTKLEWQAATDALGGRLVVGVDWAKEDYKQSGDWSDLTEDSSIAGVFGEFSKSMGEKLDLSLSLRRDDHSMFGGFNSARLALAYRIDDATLVRAQAGSGYRAPSNFELFSFYGAETLEAESSSNFDIGVEHTFAGGNFRATAFLLEVDNLIDFDPDGVACPAFSLYGPGCYNQVEGISRRKGIELAGQVEVSDKLTLAGAYTYTDSATSASSVWAGVPRHLVSLDLSAAFTPTLAGRIGVSGAMDRPDSSGESMSDYAVVNAAVTKDFGDDVQAYLRVENLLDESYQLVPHYGTSGRAIYAGLRARF